MDTEILLWIMGIIFYAILIGGYILLIYITNKKAKNLQNRQWHYICNIASMAILLTTLITPINQLLGYALACFLLIIDLTLSHRQK